MHYLHTRQRNRRYALRALLGLHDYITIRLTLRLILLVLRMRVVLVSAAMISSSVVSHSRCTGALTRALMQRTSLIGDADLVMPYGPLRPPARSFSSQNSDTQNGPGSLRTHVVISSRTPANRSDHEGGHEGLSEHVRQVHKQRTEEQWQLSSPFFNTGLIFFRKSNASDRFFACVAAQVGRMMCQSAASGCVPTHNCIEQGKRLLSFVCHLS